MIRGRRPGSLLVVPAAVSLVMFPDAARANDMGGLAFLVFIWPAGLLCLLALAVLLVLSARNGRKAPEGFSPKFAKGLLAAAALIGAGFPLFSFYVMAVYSVNAPSGITFISLAPVVAAAAAVAAVNLHALVKKEGAGQ